MSDLQRAIEDAIMFHELQLRSMQDLIDKDVAPSSKQWYRDAKGYTKTALDALRDALKRQPDPDTGPEDSIRKREK